MKMGYLTDRKAVEDVYESLPQLDAIFSFAFVVETVNSENKFNVDNLVVWFGDHYRSLFLYFSLFLLTVNSK